MNPPVQEKRTQTSAGMETVDETVKRAQTMLQPTVSATDLVNPPKPVQVPPPTQPSIPSGTLNIARNVARDVNGFISAQTEEAKQLKELQATYGALSNEGSLSDLFNSTREQFGATPEAFQELKDLQLQLADMDEASALTKARIEGAAGQTLAQGQREVTQEDKENAIRSATKAARAAVLTGNIETATTLAKDAVNIAYQDRTLKAQNLINQIEMVQGQVDQQTAQLLEQEKRGYEAELAAIKEVKDAVSAAMVNGASQSEMAQLTDPNLDDATKLALAQSITARGANELRDLEIESKNATIANTYSQISSRELNDTIALAEKGDVDAINKLGFDPRSTTGNFEAESDLRKEFNTLPTVKEAVNVQQSYKSINSALQEATDAINRGGSPAAADQALIISFNKMLDPTSVVREGEFARSTQGQAILAQLQAKVDAAIRGGAGLTDQMRQEIVNTTGVLYNDYVRTHNDTAYDYRQNALRQGADPKYVAGYIDTTTPPDQAQDGDILVINGIPMEKQGTEFIVRTDL